MTQLYPIHFWPIYKEKVWGGMGLSRQFGRQLPSDNVGESWEIAAHAHGTSVVANGPLQGKNLVELMALYGRELIGTALPQSNLKEFPLLLKIIDAHDYLSVQVHPDDEYAADHEVGEPGKWEAWYVVAAEPGAEIIYGLDPRTTRDDLRQAIDQGAFEQLLRRVPVQAGDIFDVPAGVVHALGKGVMVAEIQQNSDTVYRLYDWDRPGDDGNPRPLHIKQALDVIQFSGQRTGMVPGLTMEISQGVRDIRVANRYFALEILAVDGTMVEATGGERFHLLTCLEGSFILAGESPSIPHHYTPLQLAPGVSILIPACLNTYSLVGEGTIMKCYVPDIRANIVEPLSAYGYTLEEITRQIAGLGDYRTSHPSLAGR